MFHGIHVVCRKLRDPEWIEHKLMWIKRQNPNVSRVRIYKKYQGVNLFILRKEMDRNLSDKHRSTTLSGYIKLKAEKINI